MKTPRNNDPFVIRELIANLCDSSNGDERLMGEALRFYAKDCPNDQLVAAMDNTSDSFINVLMAFREQLYVYVDVSELRNLAENCPDVKGLKPN